MYLLLTSKSLFALGIFLLTIIVGFIPIKIAKHNVRFLGICDAFASGIFFSTALLHLLPDAAAKFNAIHGEGYPLAYLIVISTFILLIIIEQGAVVYGRQYFSKNTAIAPSFLIILLTIHSLVEGAAIGTNTNILEATAIFLAVFAHKGSESFALATNLRRSNLSSKTIQKIITFFSLVTPIGIFAASFIVSSLEESACKLFEAFFFAIAAGTFLYLGIEHLVEGKKYSEQPTEIISLISGIALMAIVAIWT